MHSNYLGSWASKHLFGLRIALKYFIGYNISYEYCPTCIFKYGLKFKLRLLQCLLCLLALGDVQTIFNYLSNILFIVKNGVTMDFNVSRVTIFIVMDVLYCYRLFGLFDIFKRTGVVSPTTRLILFMGKHITGYFFRQLSLPRRYIGHFNCFIISINNIKRMTK